MENENEKPICWTSPLIENRRLSMGRTMTWLVFGMMGYLWMTDSPVAESMVTVFLVMVTYTFGKKVRDVAKDWVNNDKAAQVIKDVELEED